MAGGNGGGMGILLKTRLWLVVACLLGGALTAWARPNIENQTLNARISAFGKALGKAEEEGPLDALGKAKQVGAFFVEAPEIDIGHGFQPVNRRELILPLLAQMQALAESARVTFPRRTVYFHPDGIRATTTLVTEAFVRLPGRPEERHRGTFDVVWVRQGGTWLIESVRPANEAAKAPAAAPVPGQQGTGKQTAKPKQGG